MTKSIYDSYPIFDKDLAQERAEAAKAKKSAKVKPVEKPAEKIVVLDGVRTMVRQPVEQFRHVNSVQPLTSVDPATQRKLEKLKSRL